MGDVSTMKIQSHVPRDRLDDVPLGTSGGGLGDEGVGFCGRGAVVRFVLVRGGGCGMSFGLADELALRVNLSRYAMRLTRGSIAAIIGG